MNSPIPEPMAEPHAVERGPRPEALKYFMAIALFFTVAGLVYCDGTMTEYSVAADLIVYGFLSVIWLGLLWFLWVGHNWARIVVMIFCGLTLINPFFIGEDSLLQVTVVISDLIFSLIWLWWLRSPAAVAFTTGRTTHITST